MVRRRATSAHIRHSERVAPSRWTLLLACLALIAFGLAVATFLVPVGVVSDSDCGLPIQAFLRHEFNQVCNPEGRRRLRLVTALLFASAALAVAAFVIRRRTRSSSS